MKWICVDILSGAIQYHKKTKKNLIWEGEDGEKNTNKYQQQSNITKKLTLSFLYFGPISRDFSILVPAP